MLQFYFKTAWLRYILGALGLTGTALEFEAIFVRSQPLLVEYFIPIFISTNLLLLILIAGVMICLPAALYYRRLRTVFYMLLQMCFAGILLLIGSFLLAVLGGSIGGH